MSLRILVLSQSKHFSAFYCVVFIHMLSMCGINDTHSIITQSDRLMFIHQMKSGELIELTLGSRTGMSLCILVLKHFSSL